MPGIELAPLTINLDNTDHHPSVAVSGRADYSNIAEVANVLARLADANDQCVSLDLSGVLSMDTAALECLAGSAGVYRERRKRIRLTCASAPVHNLLERLLLCDLFCCEAECGRGAGQCVMATREWELDVFTLPCNMSYCGEARARVKRIADTVGFTRGRRDDVMLAVGEAITNAIRYGMPKDGPASFTISCVATPEKLSVSINDSGPGFCPDDLPSFEDALMNEHGRGVHCMRAVMDEVSFDFQAGTTVRMIKLGP